MNKPDATKHKNDALDYIILLIESTGLSRVRLAKRLDITTRQLQNYMNGFTPTPYLVQHALEELAE